MVTVAETHIAENLSEFIEKYADDDYCLELLRFFGEYPRARFSELAVIHALNPNHGKCYVKRALGRLAGEGIVRISFDNNLLLYALTEDESLHSLVSSLSSLDWRQWQWLLSKTYSVPR